MQLKKKRMCVSWSEYNKVRDRGSLFILEFTRITCGIFQILLDSDHRTDQRKHRCVFCQDFRELVTQALWSRVSGVEKTDNATISSPYRPCNVFFPPSFCFWHERLYLDTFTVNCRQVGYSHVAECTQNTGLNGPIVLLLNIKQQRVSWVNKRHSHREA